MLEHRFVPAGDLIIETAHFLVPPGAVLADAASDLSLRVFGGTSLVWHVDVGDLRGSVLARGAVPIWWGHVRRVA